MRGLLDLFLSRMVVAGQLTVRWPDGSFSNYSGAPGPSGGISLGDDRSVRRLVLNPSLGLGEGYMDGPITPLDCSLYQMMEVLAIR